MHEQFLTVLVLNLREKEGKEERRALTRLGGRHWGTVGSGAFGTHQRVTLARVPQLFQSSEFHHSHLPVHRGFNEEEKKEERRVGENPLRVVPVGAPKC